MAPSAARNLLQSYHIMVSAHILLLPLLSVALGMDTGASGVYDSPSATDQYVQRFGFMFGGGRSGIHGVQALEENNDPLHQVHLPNAPSLHLRPFRKTKMRELSPLTVEMQKEQKKRLFSRFMAVP